MLFAGGYSGAIKVVDLQQKLDLGEVQASKTCIHAMAVAADKLAVATEEGTLLFYRGLELLKAVQAHNKAIVHVSAQQQIVVTASKDRKIKFWNAASMAHLRTLRLAF